VSRLPQLLLWLVIAAGVLLVASRAVVFEAVNQYRAASIGFGTAAWALGIGLPVLASAVLVVAPLDRRRALPLVAGLLLGAALALVDQSVTALAFFVDDDHGYSPGPGWWLSLAGLLLVLVAVLRAGSAARHLPETRSDWAATLGLVVVLAALALWVSRFYPDQGLWVPPLAPGVLLALVCLPVAVLAWHDVQRRTGLVAVTVYGTYVVAGQVQLIAEGSTWTGTPDAVVAVGCAVVMVGAAHVCQRLRPRSPAGAVAAG
jgi:hypothetical protein